MHQTKPSSNLSVLGLTELMTMAELALHLRRTRSGVDKLRVRDSTFPKPFKDGDNRRARVYFVRDEVESWLRGKLDSRAEAA
ncbi:MAG: helix-turn-helix transcriptional regulator [Pseudomonas sp.]